MVCGIVDPSSPKKRNMGKKMKESSIWEKIRFQFFLNVPTSFWNPSSSSCNPFLLFPSSLKPILPVGTPSSIWDSSLPLVGTHHWGGGRGLDPSHAKKKNSRKKMKESRIWEKIGFQFSKMFPHHFGTPLPLVTTPLHLVWTTSF